MAAVVGSLLARLSVDKTGLTNGLRAAGVDVTQFERQTNRRFQQLDRSTKTHMTNIGRSVAGLASTFGKGLLASAAGIGVAGLVGELSEVARSVAEIGDRAKQAGLDAQSFQKLAFVAAQNRIEVDDLTSGIREMQLRMNEFITSAGKSGTAAETLNRLGYSVDEIQRKLHRPLELFTEIIGKVEKLDRASQIRIFDDIFGGDGERLVRLLAEGEKGIRGQIKAAEDLGIVLDDEVIAKAQEIDRQFNVITTTIGTGLKRAIVDAVSGLGEFIDSYRDFQNQQDSTLNAELADIGQQRLDIENKILKLREQQANAIPGNPFGHDFESDIATLKEADSYLADREAKILAAVKQRQDATASEQTQVGALNQKVKELSRSIESIPNKTFTITAVYKTIGGDTVNVHRHGGGTSGTITDYDLGGSSVGVHRYSSPASDFTAPNVQQESYSSMAEAEARVKELRDHGYDASIEGSAGFATGGVIHPGDTQKVSFFKSPEEAVAIFTPLQTAAIQRASRSLFPTNEAGAEDFRPSPAERVAA